MILDNLTRAMKTQNWLAAGIEFLIVVAGVVIGFQINAWAEAQADRARADALVARLTEDFRLIVDDTIVASERIDGHVRAAVRVRDTLRSGIPPEDDAAFRADLFQAMSTYPVSAGSPTFAEMQATGDLDLIEDRALRAALVVFEQHTQEAYQVSGFLLPAFLEAVAEIDPHANYSLLAGAQSGAVVDSYDLDALQANAHVFQTLARNKGNLDDLIARQLELAEAVQDRLEQMSNR